MFAFYSIGNTVISVRKWQPKLQQWTDIMLIVRPFTLTEVLGSIMKFQRQMNKVL